MLAAHDGAEWVVGKALSLQRTWGSRLVVALLIGPLERAGVSIESLQRRSCVEGASLDGAATARRSGTATRTAQFRTRNRPLVVLGRGRAARAVPKEPQVSPLVAATSAVHARALKRPRAGWVMAL